MIRTLVIEDEPSIRKSILNLLEELKEEVVVIGNCGTVEEALILARNCQPELVLLDVNLTDGTGFDFLNQLKQRNFHVIFITAYKEYALEALKQGALDYLLKPIDEEELAMTIQKAIVVHNNRLNERLQIVNDHLEGKNDKIVLRLFDSFQIIRLDELVYCQSDAGYTTFHLEDKRKFTISKSIKEYQKILPEGHFFRTHQSYIVNLNFIDRYEKSGILILRGEVSVPVAIRKKEALLKKIF